MSKMNIKPLADRVLVEASEAETKTSSGIIIPDTAKEKPQRGKTSNNSVYNNVKKNIHKIELWDTL